MSVNQIGGKRGQLIVLALCPAELNCHVLALDEPIVFQTNAERGDEPREWTRRRAVEKSNHRHGRLLRACRKRPHDNPAAEERDELAPLHGSQSLLAPKAQDLSPVGEKDTQLNAYSSVGAMFALGQKQTCAAHKAMSALPLKADIDCRLPNVGFVPEVDIRASKALIAFAKKSASTSRRE
jgi:hypothetical protein